MQKLCECGCGHPTKLYQRTNRRLGVVAGQPARILKGHNSHIRDRTSSVIERTPDNRNMSDVVVDECDLPILDQYTWRVIRPDGKKAYVATSVNGSTVYLHRFITGANKGVEVDHINGDPLDNRRSNLRLATRQENCMNRPPTPGTTSRFKGVSWSKSSNKWVAVIHENGRKTTLGYFADEREAAQTYNSAAKKRYGEFAYLNDI